MSKGKKKKKKTKRGERERERERRGPTRRKKKKKERKSADWFQFLSSQSNNARVVCPLRVLDFVLEHAETKRERVQGPSKRARGVDEARNDIRRALARQRLFLPVRLVGLNFFFFFAFFFLSTSERERKKKREESPLSDSTFSHRRSDANGRPTDPRNTALLVLHSPGRSVGSQLGPCSSSAQIRRGLAAAADDDAASRSHRR